MRLKLILIFTSTFYLLATTCAFGEESNKFVFLFGGGGEVGAKTIFDQEASNLAQFFDNSKNEYQTQVVFDGENKSLKDTFAKNNIPRKDAITDNIKSAIDDHIQKIKNNQIKAGDQLLIYVMTHGDPGKAHEQTHTVSIMPDIDSDNQSAYEGRFSLDKLKTLKDVASKAGVKLAIVDQSCFSGNTLTLADSNTCVITAATSKTVGYATFGVHFSKGMKKGRSLEEVYLQSRAEHTGFSGTPQISTDEGRVITKLFEGLDDYTQAVLLYDWDDKFLSSRDEAEGICGEIPSNIKQFDSVLEDVKKILHASSPEIKELEEVTKAYWEEYRKVRNEFLAKESDGSKTLAVGSVSVEWRDLQKFNVQNKTAAIQRKLAPLILEDHQKNKDKIKKMEKEIEDYLQLEKLRKTTLESKEFAEYQDKIKQFKSSQPMLVNLSGDVKKAEQAIYGKLYKKLKTEKSNPCADFVL